MPRNIEDQLILEDSSLSKKVSTLFDEMKGNKRLASSFVRNPANVLSYKVLPEKFAKSLDRNTLQSANNLLYSVLDNEKFSKWLRDYQEKLVDEYNKTGELPEKTEMRKEMSKALFKYGDEKIIESLITGHEIVAHSRVSELQKYADVAVEIETLIYAVVAAAAFAVVVAVVGFVPDEVNQQISQINPAELRVLSQQLVKQANYMTRRLK